MAQQENKADVISNIKVYGLENSFKVSKYPMSTDVTHPSTAMTTTIRKLSHAECGSGHDNFLKGIVAQFDLTFSIKAWTEAERYHFFDIVSSQSTMHKILDFDFDNPIIFDSHTSDICIEAFKKVIEDYNEFIKTNPSAELQRQAYQHVLYSCPVGLKLTAGMTTNYQQLKTIYFQRRNHRLDEWRIFCKQLEDDFPYFKELIL